MFIDTTLTLSDLSSWCASGKCYWNVTPSGSISTMYQFPISLQRAECLLLGALCVFNFIVWQCLSFFLPTLNCTRQDILFWNGTTRSALINRLCYFYGNNRILSLCWNIVRECILSAKKNGPKLDHSIIYSCKTLFLPFLKVSHMCDLNLCINWTCELAQAC